MYWDDFASVVPADPDVYAVAVSAELEDLRDRGLYHPVVLGSQYDEPLDPDTDFGVIRQELRRLAARSARPQASVMDAFLFRSKVGRSLEVEILRLGLGRRLAGTLESGCSALAVTKEVQLLLLGELVRGVALNTDTRAYTPYTDQRSIHEASLLPIRRGFGDGAWRVELGRLLPMPAPGTPVSAVLEFRDRYAAERERLIGATQTMLCDLRRQWEHPADVLERLRLELKQAREDYQAAARASSTAWVHRSISVTIGVATAAGAALVFPDFEWAAGIAGSIGFNIATREVRPLVRARKGHPFRYLHLVDRELA
ncbi:hypothetical protein ACH4Q6_17210 [Streptomyces lydicus]|uniref:hypothetical protein n=1 Tax=Streptomyces lydicus TaxID=47763 RepID=UPI0037A5BA6E